jgi:spoIIIJ-associated protein
MVYEFEGKTEKEAIDKAVEELGLGRDGFDVEIVEAKKDGFLFKKGWVKIRVHTDAEPTRTPEARQPEERQPHDRQPQGSEAAPPRERRPVQPRKPGEIEEFEGKMIEFVSNVLVKMDYPSKVSILFREEGKVGLRIESEHSAIIIGKKGKNLDSIQLIANVYAGRIGFDDTRIILDSENYRIRREEALVRLAYTTAEKVRASRQSILLEPMNPFERRLIHTTLNDIGDIETKSEGEGLYKQVRVLVRGRS